MTKSILSARGRFVIYNLLIVGAILAIYGGLVYHPFHTFDDPGYVTDNYYVQNGLTFEGCAWAFRSVDVANWHPLTWLSHMTDVEVFGPNPAGHYLTNILLHVASSLLLFWLVWRVGGNEQMGFVVALIWAVHPANVECVAWIAERKSLLATVFMLAGMISYHRYCQGGSRCYYLLSIVAHLLASMAKPIAVLFPVALVLIESFSAFRDGVSPTEGLRRSWRTELSKARGWLLIIFREKTPFIAISGYLAILTFIAQDEGGATAFTYSSRFLWRCGNALEALWWYTAKSFSMSESSLLYVLEPLDGLVVFLGGLLVLLMVLCAIACFREKRVVSIGLAWYLLMFLPTIGIVQVGSQRMADRYLGWPLIGLICVVCYGVTMAFRCCNSRVLPVIALGAWAIGLGWQTRALCVDWEDDLRLSRNAIFVGGYSPAMLNNCAVLEVQRHDFQTARRYLAAKADRGSPSLNIAIIDLDEKKYKDAIAEARRISRDKKDRLMAAGVAGQAFDRLNMPYEARRAYMTAIDWLPTERSYKLSVERLRFILPGLAAAAAAREEDLIAGKEPDIRWRTKGRMELSR